MLMTCNQSALPSHWTRAAMRVLHNTHCLKITTPFCWLEAWQVEVIRTMCLSGEQWLGFSQRNVKSAEWGHWCLPRFPNSCMVALVSSLCYRLQNKYPNSQTPLRFKQCTFENILTKLIDCWISVRWSLPVRTKHSKYMGLHNNYNSRHYPST
jgi:hypothetical protein